MLTRLCSLLTEPFFLEDGIQILIPPLALKPDVLEKMPFAAHPKALQQGHRGGILTVGNRDDAMEIKRQKGIGEETRERLCGKPLPLIGTREGIASFGLPVIMFIDLEGTISNQHTCFLEFDGNLKPLSRHTRLKHLLLLKKSVGLRFTYPLPALVSGDFGVIAIGHECRKVRIHKVPQPQSACFESREIYSRHWRLFSLPLLLHWRHLLWILCLGLIEFIGLPCRGVGGLLRVVALSIRLRWLLYSCWRRRSVVGLLWLVVGWLLVL